MQRFELSDGSSNKFRQIAREVSSLRVTFGKIGTAGQTQLKELSSDAMAIAEHDELVREKTKKGYALVVINRSAIARSSTNGRFRRRRPGRLRARGAVRRRTTCGRRRDVRGAHGRVGASSGSLFEELRRRSLSREEGLR